MKYSLDTNTCIRYINGRSPQIRIKLSTLPIEDIIVCSIVRAELFLGAAKSHHPSQTLAKQQAFLRPYQTLSFDDGVAAIYGPMRAKLELAGTPIGPLDLLIGAIALANDLILVTHNVKEFGRIDGLKIEDWELSTT